jgi:hypothetical protein
MTQGTVNGGDRGNTRDRRRRREWLVENFRADVDASVARGTDGIPFDVQLYNERLTGCGYRREPACRCYRCGTLLTVDTVSPDRIIPGCQGGTYRRNNIRPACLRCQSVTGNEIKRAIRKKSR